MPSIISPDWILAFRIGSRTAYDVVPHDGVIVQGDVFVAFGVISTINGTSLPDGAEEYPGIEML